MTREAIIQYSARFALMPAQAGVLGSDSQEFQQSQ